MKQIRKRGRGKKTHCIFLRISPSKKSGVGVTANFKKCERQERSSLDIPGRSSDHSRGPNMKADYGKANVETGNQTLITVFAW